MNKKTAEAENALKAVQLSAAYFHLLQTDYYTRYPGGRPKPIDSSIYTLRGDSLMIYVKRGLTGRHGLVTTALCCHTKHSELSTLHCSLAEWPKNGEDHPLKKTFDHWKQHLRFNADETVSEMLQQIVSHLHYLGIELEMP